MVLIMTRVTSPGNREGKEGNTNNDDGGEVTMERKEKKNTACDSFI